MRKEYLDATSKVNLAWVAVECDNVAVRRRIVVAMMPHSPCISTTVLPELVCILGVSLSSCPLMLAVSIGKAVGNILTALQIDLLLFVGFMPLRG